MKLDISQIATTGNRILRTRTLEDLFFTIVSITKEDCKKSMNADNFIGVIIASATHVKTFNAARNAIAKETRRGAGNTIIMHPCASFRNKSKFEPTILLDERVPIDKAIVMYVGQMEHNKLCFLRDNILHYDDEMMHFIRIIPNIENRSE